MRAHKVRFEVYDESGEKYTIDFKGHITRDKATRLLDLVELLGGMREFGNELEWAWNKKKMTKFERVRLTIEKDFRLTWFSSREVQSAYEEEFSNPIRLSTVSTYLSRLTDRGFLVRNGQGKSVRYKPVTGILNRFWSKGKREEKIGLRL